MNKWNENELQITNYLVEWQEVFISVIVKWWNVHKNVHNSDSEFSGLMTFKKDLLIYSSKWNKLKQTGVKWVVWFWESYFLSNRFQTAERGAARLSPDEDWITRPELPDQHTSATILCWRVTAWVCVVSYQAKVWLLTCVCVCVLCYRIQCYLLPGWSVEAGLNPC